MIGEGDRYVSCDISASIDNKADETRCARSLITKLIERNHTAFEPHCVMQ